MLSRALILAAVAFVLGCFGATSADAQNLEAGKPPSQIFSSTCSLCHKSSRGLLKSVSPGSLPGFLRQHYTTSTDMAAAMSAYVLSNGAANAAPGGGNLTRQGQEAKGGRPGQEPGPEQAAKGRKPPTQEAARPDADGLQSGAPDSQTMTARQKAAAERRAARQAAREAARAAKDPAPPKIEDRHGVPKDEPAADAAKQDAGKTEPAKDSDKSETAKVEGTRPDPVPAVTPAPKDGAKPAEVAAAPPKEDVPSGPLTIDIGPAPPPPAPVVPVGPPPVPAGNPEPPISR
ncbi:hypothetical protein HNQ36_001328 [Afipia massiliensis]|uniref:Cytochrome c domain-containing protein n=1 Tax=Afipia massiliensis TaxID=211460 RepID=A0A840MY71_9BRAD|nr:hypothetical protein [Afipia massiliensis]MBB5051374.1 hypothetical protein [Afipia massiliensis]